MRALVCDNRRAHLQLQHAALAALRRAVRRQQVQRSVTMSIIARRMSWQLRAWRQYVLHRQQVRAASVGVSRVSSVDGT
jgi:hypothetical protein